MYGITFFNNISVLLKGWIAPANPNNLHQSRPPWNSKAGPLKSHLTYWSLSLNISFTTTDDGDLSEGVMEFVGENAEGQSP